MSEECQVLVTESLKNAGRDLLFDSDSPLGLLPPLKMTCVVGVVVCVQILEKDRQPHEGIKLRLAACEAEALPQGLRSSEDHPLYT